MDAINQSLTHYSGLISGLAWGPWLLVLLLGGGTYFLIRTRFLPFRYLGHAFALLTNRYDHSDAPGHVSHARALSTALAGTIGMGNIAGVALAIQIGGPGAIFWMWVTAIIGMATKFFTCSLAVMYRGQDDRGEVQGGPMYVIRNALPKRWHWLAYMFAAFGMIGSLPVLQTNQLVQAIRESILIPGGVIAAGSDVSGVNLLLGTGIALLAAVVIFGGILRISSVAVRVVPLMGLLYVGAAVLALVLHADQVPAAFALILHDAFTGEAAAGGSLLAMILYGVRRGAYSNEAGIGTESLAHGAAKTREPVREGLIAMLGPIFDTLLICTATALVVITAGSWQGDATGVTMTAQAFTQLLGTSGTAVVVVCVVAFASTTILTYSFYGGQCASFLFGSASIPRYRWAYVAFVVVASVLSLQTAINIIDTAFALMAIPTMFSALWLAPKVMQAAEDYFARLRQVPPGPQAT